MKNNINISLRSDEIEALKKEFPDKTPGKAVKAIIRKQIYFIITKQISNEKKEAKPWIKQDEITPELAEIAKTKWIDD